MGVLYIFYTKQKNGWFPKQPKFYDEQKSFIRNW